jgi:hypothetical protein
MRLLEFRLAERRTQVLLQRGLPTRILSPRGDVMRTTLLIAAMVFGLGAPALASGTVRIQQSNGTVQTYTGVTFRVVNKTLMLTSADKVSTVVISGGTCAHNSNLVRCTGGGLSLQQDGKTHNIPFKTAAFYFNVTNQDQTVPQSTMKVGPHSVVFSAQTAKGTSISGDGKLDQEVQK